MPNSEDLIEGPRTLHLESKGGDTFGEHHVGAVGFLRLRGPLVSDRCAVALQCEGPGNFAGSPFRRLDVRAAFGQPAPAGRGNLELLMAHGLSIELNGERSFVLGQDPGGGGSFLLCGERKS